MDPLLMAHETTLAILAGVLTAGYTDAEDETREAFLNGFHAALALVAVFDGAAAALKAADIISQTFPEEV